MANRPRQRVLHRAGNQARTPVVPRILKAGIYAALAAAMAIFCDRIVRKHPLAVFANAKASLIGSAHSAQPRHRNP